MSAQYQTPEMVEVLVDLVEVPVDLVEVLVDLVDSPVVVDTSFVTMEPYPDLVD